MLSTETEIQSEKPDENDRYKFSVDIWFVWKKFR